jgi:hypothetical protein
MDIASRLGFQFADQHLAGAAGIGGKRTGFKDAN